MKKLLLRSTLFACLSALSGCDQRPGPPDPAVSKGEEIAAHTIQWRIDSLMKAHFAADGPGVTLAVGKDSPDISKNGAEEPIRSAVAYHFAAGVTDLTEKSPVSDTSVFNIGSLTKQFTAHAILHFAESDKQLLTAPIGQYLKGLKPAIAALKISQLLSHCSGIPDHYGFTDTNRVKHATNKDVFEAISKADSLYFPAGSRYRYSNTAYCLLGMLVEKLSAMRYETFIETSLAFTHRQNTISPFPTMSFLPASAAIGNRVHGYEKNKSGQWAEADAPESIFFTTQADGGMLISMRDYIRWCGLLEISRRSGFAFPEFEPHTLVDTAAGLYYGYGWFVLPRKTRAGPLIYHTGFNGGFRTSVLLIPDLGYRIAIFSASPGVDLEELVHQINLILGIDDKGFIKSGPLES